PSSLSIANPRNDWQAAEIVVSRNLHELAALVFLAIALPGHAGSTELAVPASSKTVPITMSELAKLHISDVSVIEVSDYIFGGYTGDWASPPHADLNPKRAFIIRWKNFAFRFVFAH